MQLTGYYKQSVIDNMDQASAASMANIINDLLKSNMRDAIRMQTLWDEYKGNVPIVRKIHLANPYAPDNRAAHDYRGMIIQQIVGYMFGNPIKYTISKQSINENIIKVEKLISDFLRLNHFQKMDASLESFLATCGKAFRLLYFINDPMNDNIPTIKMLNINPWECLVLEDSTLQIPKYGMRYWQVQVVDDNVNSFPVQEAARLGIGVENPYGVIKTPKMIWKIEWYDDEYVYYFTQNTHNKIIPDNSSGMTFQKHGFGFMPIIKFQNNELEEGDFEKVRTLIDDADKVISFILNDNEAFSNSLMLFEGFKPSPELFALATKLRAIAIPPSRANETKNDIRYLTKDIQSKEVEILYKILDENIFKLSSTINMSDEKFSGASQTGVSRKFKLIPLENKAKTKERLYAEGMQRMFKVCFSLWNVLYGLKFDYTEIDYEFSRNLPIDTSNTDLVALHQEGIISTPTAISQLSFVDNVEDELKLLRVQQTSGSLETFNTDLGNLSLNPTSGSKK